MITKLSLLPFSMVFAVVFAATSTAGTLDCAGCHGTPSDMRPVDDASTRNVLTGGFKGSHRSHSSRYACVPCHNNSGYTPDHRDGKIQMARKLGNYSGAFGRAHYLTTRPTTSDGSSVFFNQTTLPVLARCANVACHFEHITPVWGDNTTTICSTCHGAPPAGVSPTYTGGAAGSHAQHDSYYSSTTSCRKCHDISEKTSFSHATSAGIRPLVLIVRDPLNNLAGSYSIGTVNDYLPSKAAQHVFGTCSTTYCHSNGTSVSSGTIPPNTTPPWGSGQLNCRGCHGSPPYYTNGSPKANTHEQHVVTMGYGCNFCHYDVTANGVTINDPSHHVNKEYNVSAWSGGIQVSYTFSAGGGACVTECHTGYLESVVQWGGTACLSCHTAGGIATLRIQDPSTHDAGGAVENDTVCFDCHVEANPNGTINHLYHPRIVY